MHRILLLTLLTISLNGIHQISKAQSASKETLANDTTIYDDKTPSNGHDLQLPQPTLGWEPQYKLINKEFTASAVFKKNKIPTKVEVASLVEKDGSVSAYTVKGTGPETMKNELVRILKLTVKYEPGTRDGEPVRCRVYQPFEFKYE